MSDASVEISFRADLSDLESGAADAVAAIGRASDAILRIAEESSLKQIAIAEDRNDFLLRMGEESLDQWKANAIAQENAKLAAELSYLDKKSAADQAEASAEARDLEQRRTLYAAHALALQKIDEEAAERKRALDRQELSDDLSADNAKLQDGIRALDAEYKEHQISADERYRLEQTLTAQIYAEEINRLDALIAKLQQGTKAYEDAMKQRQKLEQDFTKQSEANTNRLETEEAAKWTQLSNSIRSSFNSAIDGMLFQGKTFLQGMLAIAEGVIKAFLEMGEKIAEDWIQRQIESLFMTESVQATTATTEVTTQAGIAAATAYAQYAAFPPVAEAMAAEAFAATMAWGMPKLAMGAWDLKSDMVAELHRGEMVVPENFASGLRANGGGFGGGDVHMNYSPTLHAREPASLAQMLVSESSAMLAWLRRQMRNGAIGMA